jgi:hypothetical protein
VQINTTTTAVNDTGLNLDLPAGPYLKVSAQTAQLAVLGQTLSGSFAIEQKTVEGGRKLTRLAATNVFLSLGGTSPVVSVTNGQGSLLLTPDGTGGELQANVALKVPGATFNGHFGVSLNSTGARVNDSFAVGTDTVTLDVPAGPYLRVEGTGIQATILGLTLTGDFSFEQVTRVGGGQFVRVAAQHVGVNIGTGTTPVASISNGAVSLLVIQGGTADQSGVAG